MNPDNQVESSGNLSGLPLKRKRGRPRKDPSLKHTGVSPHAPQRFEATKQTVVTETMVGEAVNGVIEASFDAGYLLSVRIGNSSTNLRGVVFKPGHCVPITAENDIAPHVQMIQREGTFFPGENSSSARGQKLAVQRAGMKKSQENRDNVVPVTLKHLNFQEGWQSINHNDKDKNPFALGSASPPTIPVSQLFGASQTHINRGVVQGSEQEDNDVSFNNDGTTSEDGQGEKSKLMTSTDDVDTPGSSPMSDFNIENGKEASKSSAEDSGIFVSKQEVGTTDLPFSRDSGIVSEQELENVDMPFSTKSLQSVAVPTPFLNFGAGRMTELLQAMRENVKDTQVPVAETEPPPSACNVESRETDRQNNASAP